jgi:hypothetical protein
MKILVKSACGSDDPTKAVLPFLHANALAFPIEAHLASARK